jgi:anaerobic ribonucleoside-triphosphate reductase activating protein
MLRYKETAIVLYEVPDEISLAINICGCIHHCPDCHSKYLWNDDGDLLMKDFADILREYGPFISCVCFMGGDHDQKELVELCKIVHKKGYKTCLYTGEDTTGLIKGLLNELDYVKTGRFIKEKGPLNCPTTNQRMFKKVSGDWQDITSIFWKKYGEKEN